MSVRARADCREQTNDRESEKGQEGTQMEDVQR